MRNARVLLLNTQKLLQSKIKSWLQSKVGMMVKSWFALRSRVTIVRQSIAGLSWSIDRGLVADVGRSARPSLLAIRPQRYYLVGAALAR
jgi:hypothetical protein